MATFAISGSTGFLGTAVGEALRARGDRVVALVRPGTRAEGIGWDPEAGQLDRAALEGIDGVIHLAGESLAGGRWTDARKARIEESRVRGTSLLAKELAALARPPKVWLSGSAIGFYGDTGDHIVDETAPAGSDFLARVCASWEAAAAPAAQSGIRLAHPRFGVVLDPAGGALGKMLPAFRFGLGGALGAGTQWMSWITRKDAVGALLHLLDRDSVSGPINLTTPHPITNAEFTETLARVLSRPALVRVPRFALRAAFGEMADATLLSSSRVSPGKLQESGFRFAHPELGPALRALLATT